MDLVVESLHFILKVVGSNPRTINLLLDADLLSTQQIKEVGGANQELEWRLLLPQDSYREGSLRVTLITVDHLTYVITILNVFRFFKYSFCSNNYQDCLSSQMSLQKFHLCMLVQFCLTKMDLPRIQMCSVFEPEKIKC